MIMITHRMSPCKGCDDRCIGCHSSCGDYAEYKKLVESDREERARISDEYEFHNAEKRECFRRFSKRRKGDDR